VVSIFNAANLIEAFKAANENDKMWIDNLKRLKTW